MEILSKQFREITRAVFARYGFAQGDVVGHWAEIVGNDLAAYSAPERIKWPRQHGETAQKTGGTLVIRAAPGRAFDLQYAGPRIITRINSFFGYGAVTQIKVMQATEPTAKEPERPAVETIDPVLDQRLEEMDESPLKTALTRLSRSVAGGCQSSPQGK
jgi:hypothetical protein